MIQDSGLLPHISVKQNIELVGKISNREVSEDRIAELLMLIGLDSSFLEKRPSELSGGQQQRIGIARALATNPSIILMDEPFSALDNITRSQLQDDFLHLDQLGDKTILLVTHDVQEAFKLGDRIALLADGEIQQYGTPLELLNRPANQQVSSFLDKDRLILSLQSTKYQDQSLFQFLNDNEVSTNDKEVAIKDFFKSN